MRNKINSCHIYKLKKALEEFSRMYFIDGSIKLFKVVNDRIYQNMRILCIGDPHFKPSNRLETTQLHQEIERILLGSQVNVTIVLGDILDTFERADMDCYDDAIAFLEMIMKHSFLIVLIGNHDRKNNQVFQLDRHYFTPLKFWPRTKVVWTTEIVEIEGIKILCIPYVPAGRLNEALTEFKDQIVTCDLAVAHQEFKNAKMGAIISEHGDEWPKDYPLCVSGHIHQYQRLQDNLVYPGTPFQHGFGDSSDKCVLLLSNFENGKEAWEETRLGLNIWNKITITMTVDELLTFKAKKDVVYNINLIGDIGVIRQTIRNPQIIKMMEKYHLNIKIKSVAVDEIEQVDIVKPDGGIPSFYEFLEDMISSESKSVARLYKKILKA